MQDGDFAFCGGSVIAPDRVLHDVALLRLAAPTSVAPITLAGAADDALEAGRTPLAGGWPAHHEPPAGSMRSFITQHAGV